jgi:hypothetical protein
MMCLAGKETEQTQKEGRKPEEKKLCRRMFGEIKPWTGETREGEVQEIAPSAGI